MRTRVAIRPPEEMVAFLDRAVAEGMASSRAALVSPALEREMRRPVAEQDSAVSPRAVPAMTSTRLCTGPSATSTSASGACEICLARPDRTRPVVVLTREAARAAMTKVTVAPITATLKGLSSGVPVGPSNGLEVESVIAVDNVVTVPSRLLGRTIGILSAEQEAGRARAIVLAHDLDIPPHAH